MPQHSSETSRKPDTLPHGDLRDQTHVALRQLIDRVAVVALTLGFALVILSLLRMRAGGVTINIMLDIFIYAVVAVIVIIRNKLPMGLILPLLIGAVGLSAMGNFVTLGLATIGFVMLIACIVVAGAVGGVRSGIMVLLISILGVSGIGFFVISGKAPGSHITIQYLVSPQTWIAQTAAFAVYSVILLLILNAIQKQLAHSLSDTKRYSEDLKEREKKYRLLAENMHDVVAIQDLEMRFIYVSPSVERLSGYTVDEFLKLRMQDVMTPGSLDHAMATFRTFLAKAQQGECGEIPLLELEYIRKDGSRFWGEYKPVMLRDESGAINGSQGTLRDITDRKRAELDRTLIERQLHQSEKLQAIGTLAGGVAHDFNNQLTGIIGHADLLKQKMAEMPEVVEYADSILVPARHAAELTSKLLAFARKGTIELAPVDLHDIIGEVITLLKHSIDKTIRLVRHFEAPSAHVIGDATQLQNAILNLAINGRDAMPQGGVLTFSSRAIPPEESDLNGLPALEVMVTDSGMGIDPALMAHLFEPFFTTKETGKGSGLGLAAVYGTVKSHNGSISVKSTPGAGARFILHFPLAQQPVSVRGPAPAQAPIHGAGKVLIIDDEAVVAKSLVAMLGTVGYSTTSRMVAREAIEHYRTTWHETDLVIQDMIMPELSGDTVFGELRRINPQARILLISGFSLDSSIRELLDRGAVGFLKKPFSLTELSIKVSQCLGNKK